MILRVRWAAGAGGTVSDWATAGPVAAVADPVVTGAPTGFVRQWRHRQRHARLDSPGTAIFGGTALPGRIRLDFRIGTVVATINLSPNQSFDMTDSGLPPATTIIGAGAQRLRLGDATSTAGRCRFPCRRRTPVTIETWPPQLKARIWDPHLRNLANGGAVSPTGRQQRVFGDAGFWEIKISGIVVSNAAEAMAYRALIARLRTGEDILLPVRDLYGPVGGRQPASAAALSGAAELRATEIGLTVSGSMSSPGASHGRRQAAPRHPHHRRSGGEHRSSILSRRTRPGRIARPWSDAVTASAGYTVAILPPLRADLAEGEPVRFRDLLVRCVAKDLSEGDLDLDLGRFGRPNLTFIESL